MYVPGNDRLPQKQSYAPEVPAQVKEWVEKVREHTPYSNGRAPAWMLWYISEAFKFERSHLAYLMDVSEDYIEGIMSGAIKPSVSFAVRCTQYFMVLKSLIAKHVQRFSACYEEDLKSKRYPIDVSDERVTELRDKFYRSFKGNLSGAVRVHDGQEYVSLDKYKPNGGK